MDSGPIRHSLAAVAAAAALAFGAPSASAADFTIAFEWGDIPLCTSGSPNRVYNPTFRLSGVPTGTRTIRFTMTDLDVPGYDHGGGAVTFTGQRVIRPGVFRYRSPCPPGGSHRYEWTARALDAGGRELAQARASRDYP